MTSSTQQDDVRRLAHRVLMPGFAGTRLPRWLSMAIHDGLGGVCLFGHNVDSPAQARAMCDDAHGLGRVVVATDEEGGIVSRLGARHGSRHVGAAALGSADDAQLTEQVAQAIATDLRAAGVDLDLAPVLDVNSNPANPVIGVRSFGATPELVARHGAAFVSGLQSQGVAACGKHFPGHGDTNVDSHVGLPRIDASLETLRSRELVPFRAAVEAGAQAMMTAHIIFPALDDQPATISAPVVRLLREELGFTGVIATDAMDMQAIVNSVGMAAGSALALAAGVDLVCLGNAVLNTPDGNDEETFRAVLDAVVAAAGTEALPLDRLREAAARVDALERWVSDRRTGEYPSASTDLAPADRSAAASSLQTTGDVRGRLTEPVQVVDIRRRRNIASGRLVGLIAQELLRRLPGSESHTAFAPTATVEGRVGDETGPTEATTAGRADVIVTGTPGIDERESAELARLLTDNPEAVVVCTGWVTSADQLAPARHTIRTFGDSLPTAAAVADLLVG